MTSFSMTGFSMARLSMTSLMICMTLALGADAEDAGAWTGFRNGGRSIAQGVAPATHWTPESNIAWQFELPGYGQSAPVVLNGSLYLTVAEGPMKETCRVLALNCSDGSERWSVSVKASAEAPSNYAVARAAPTPVVDAEGVYAFFESGNLLAIGHDGKVVWQRSLTDDYGKIDNHHGLGCSPAQTAGRLYLNVQHDGPSYLLAIDKKTGKTIWKVDRPSAKSWTTPIVVKPETGVQQVVVSSAGTVTGFSAADGRQLWELKGVGGNSIPSPTAVGEFVYVGASVSDFDTETGAAQSNLCLKITPETELGYEIVWRAKKATASYASPLVCDNCVYYVNNVGVVYCLDAKTGERRYAHRLGVSCWATPVAVGNRVYFFGKNGTTKVIGAGPTFGLVATNTLWPAGQPPQPESYVETASQRRHGSASGGSRARGGFAATLLKNDKDQDGRISAAELPARMRRIMAQVDKDGDGYLNKEELDKMSEDFRNRRKHSRESSRDPIVYGTAVAGGRIFIRTGTRIYSIHTSAQEVVGE